GDRRGGAREPRLRLRQPQSSRRTRPDPAVTEGPLASVDQVRDELRRLGYLEHGVDRFVLSGAGTTSAARASARAATRVGLLGGLLFGAALTLAAAGLDPRLRGEPRD